jgi:hypothetical protein
MTCVTQEERQARLRNKKPFTEIPFKDDIDARLYFLNSHDPETGFDMGARYERGDEEQIRLGDIKHYLYMTAKYPDWRPQADLRRRLQSYGILQPAESRP